MKDEKKLQQEEKVVRTLEDDELEQVVGGGAFDNVPRVKEHDYTEDIKPRA